MNKNIVIGGIIVVILILLGFWYIASLPVTTPAPVPSTTATSTATSTPVVVPTSTTPATSAAPAATATKSAFKSIFTQSGNHECTYQQVGASSQTTSVIYISGGKMRGEFRTTGTVSSANLMIYNGGYLYSWKEGTTVGKKLSINSIADLPSVIPKDLTSGAIFGTSADSVGWNCNDWLKDNSVFVIPTYVKFTT